jgi:transposase
MPNTDAAPNRPTAIAGNDAALLVSLELSQSSWLITVLRPDRQGFATFTQPAGETDRLLEKLWQQRERAERRVGGRVKLITIYEAGLDGFWLHRVLAANGIENHVVDAGSVAAPRRGRRAKSDRLDGEALVRALAAWLVANRGCARWWRCRAWRMRMPADCRASASNCWPSGSR